MTADGLTGPYSHSAAHWSAWIAPEDAHNLYDTNKFIQSIVITPYVYVHI